MKPKVSVIMAVYNGEKYLRDAIDSILGQTFTDFEFIIVDDASTDRTPEVVASYGDPRIRYVRNDSNIRPGASANRGIELSAGEYIARLDGDDVSLPERLARQVAFMDANPDVAVCGTWARKIDPRGNVTDDIRKPVGKELEYDFWRPSPLLHSAAMIRASHLGDLRYDPAAIHVEDYDLWLGLQKNHRLDNLPEFLTLYRIHDESVTSVNFDRQMRSTHDVFSRHIGLALSFEEFCELVDFSRDYNPVRRARLRRRLAAAIGKPYRIFLGEDLAYAKDWLARLWKHNAVRTQFVRPVNHLRLRMKRRRGDASSGGKGAGRAS